jgi:hypothetical protein
MAFDLGRFEYHAYRRERELAARELLELLGSLDSHYGVAGAAGCDFHATPTGVLLSGEEADEHLLARIAGAIGCLFSDPEFRLSDGGLAQLLHRHRWLSAIFSASPFRNADAILRAMNNAGSGVEKRCDVAARDLAKYCLLYGPDAELPLDLDALYRSSRPLAVGLALALLAPRFLGSPAAHGKREVILPWLARKLEQMEDLEELPVGILHDVYMHCSYADRPDRHDIKRGINRLIRRKLAERGLAAPLPAPQPPRGGEKPVLLVVLEWFSASHSIYRTHSRTLEAARERFRTVGMGPKSVDAAGRAVFDEFIVCPGADVLAQIAHVREVAERQGAHALYMPSVGMHPLTMFLANMRIAPLQAMALGHPATSHSDQIDYVVVEEDYVGDPACFSEKLLRLPPDGMPYRPSAAGTGLDLRPQIERRQSAPEVVRIAVAATTMKLNPGFLGACARIAERAGRPVHFEFLVGQAVGLTYLQVARVVRQFLGDRATVHRQQPYGEYMRVIAGCDLFLNPFPFGNTNGIVDTVSAGLIGVCKSGPEVFEHIDEGLFGRLGWPRELVAHTVEEYIEAALRLIGDDGTRWRLSRELSGPASLQRLFQGRPELFGHRLAQLLDERLGAGEGAAAHRPPRGRAGARAQTGRSLRVA